MPVSWNRNRLTEKLGIDYPIIQGPLGGLSSQRLTAAVSNFGGLGSFGAHGLAPEAIKDVIAQIRSLTSKPFAMNLWVSMEDEGARTSDQSGFNRSLAPLAVHLAALGAPRPAYKLYSPTRFEDQARVLLDANVPAFSFIYGVPPKEILEECRAKSIVTIGTATTPDEAAVLRDAGVYAIVASGFEAGGHRGSFLRSAEDSLTGTFSLVPQIVDIVDVPVIAAGGIGDARGVVAALALGADGVQLGTAFLACEESGASPLHRKALLGKSCRTHCVDQGLHGKTRSGSPQPFDGGVEPKRNGDLAVSIATRSCKKPFNPRGGGGPIRSSASVGRAKRQSFCVYRHIGLLQLVGEGSFPNRRARHSVERKPKSEIFEFLTRRTRTMGTSGIAEKVVVITGASSGLGESTAKLLGRHGAKVGLGARRKDRIDAVVNEISADGGKAVGFAVDVTKRVEVEALIKAAVESFGRVDVLVNNAGIMPIAPIHLLKVEEWDRQIDINIKGVLYGVAAVLPQMQKQKSGHIINMASVFGIKVFAPGGTVYCATKSAVRALTEGLRMELHSENIRCTVISPGAVESELKNGTSDPSSAAFVKDLYKKIAMPADSVARAVLYAIEQPADVEIDEVVLRPTAQDF